MMFFCAMFLFFSALASYRTLEVGEAHAFRCIYGTDDMEKLIEIARDPVCFWREREEFLMAPGTTITHREFCQKFVQEAKEHIAQNCEDSKGKTSFKDGEVIDEALQSVIDDDHPAWPTMQAFLYGQACDRLSGSDRNKEFCGSEKEVPELAKNIPIVLAEDNFNDVHRWLSEPCAEYAIVDNLIMHGKGMYLSSAVEPEGRCDFRVHFEDGKFLFSGWEGVIRHDVLGHALQQYQRAYILEESGVASSTKHFNMYCGPAYIAQDDMITQSQQHLGWFYNTHELPSTPGSYDPTDIATVLFPYAASLTDSGFAQIVPFFTRKAKNWKEKALTPGDCAESRFRQHIFLLKWRNEHCAGGKRLFPEEFRYGYPGAGWVDRITLDS